MRVATLVPYVSLAWRDRAACRGVDTNLFFPGPGQGDKVREARAYCETCPVIGECLRFALHFPDRDLPGIYGGTTEPERRKLRLRLKIYP